MNLDKIGDLRVEQNGVALSETGGKRNERSIYFRL